MRHVIRWICGTVVLTLLYSRGLPGWPVVLSSALAVGILTLGLSWSGANAAQGFLAVLFLNLVVGYINTLDEALFFHVATAKHAAIGLLGGLFISVVLAVVLILVPPLRGSLTSAASTPSRIWTRVPLLAFAYVVIYFAAGLLVRPYIIAFYQSRPLPGLGELLVVEYLRGLLYLASAWPWLRLFRGDRLHGAVFLGAAYSILGGIAPLLLPNPLMPAQIRVAHGFEIGISNFVFGAIVGLALSGKSAPVVHKESQPVLP